MTTAGVWLAIAAGMLLLRAALDPVFAQQKQRVVFRGPDSRELKSKINLRRGAPNARCGCAPSKSQASAPLTTVI